MFRSDPEGWDMITLDLNLPGIDGMQVGAEIRKQAPTVPIIMLTARDSESDQVLGLEMGADDYVTKPFSPITLIARIKALHRRAELGTTKAAPSESGLDTSSANESNNFDIKTDHFKLNSNTREAYLNGEPIDDLTPKEFDLLRAWRKSLVRCSRGNSCYNKFGTTNTTVTNELLMHILRNYGKKSKRSAHKLFKLFGVSVTDLMIVGSKINEINLPTNASFLRGDCHRAYFVGDFVFTLDALHGVYEYLVNP